MKPAFEPIEENFPDEILCPICKHKEHCEEDGETCKTIDAMLEDMVVA